MTTLKRREMNSCQADHQRNKTSNSQNSPAGEGVLLRKPEDCLEGGLLSWEMERRGARPLLAAELLLWAGDGLVLTIDKKTQCSFIHFTGWLSRQFSIVFGQNGSMSVW